VWRVPFGIGAVYAGWLADRYGAKPLLVIYLLGCAASAFFASQAPTLALVFASMFAMGCFASIYHPAGLALISRETTIENRAAALGWHGIIGSIGIASAPFLAAVAFRSGTVTWQQYYVSLVVPAVALAAVLMLLLRDGDRSASAAGDSDNAVPREPDGEPRWGAFAVLVASGTLQGCIYAPFMHFLPRYLGEAGLTPTDVSPAGYRNELAARVLLCGIVGQAIAGKLARPHRLRSQLTAILFANVPFLVWMAVAEGSARVWASSLLAVVHFAAQPVYNSLIAQYVPRSRRSLGYGINSMITFSVGGLAPALAGLTPATNWTAWTYGALAAVAVVAALLTIVLPLHQKGFAGTR
jgi:MFS family permease